MSAKNHELPERLGGLIEGETNTLSFSGLTNWG